MPTPGDSRRPQPLTSAILVLAVLTLLAVVGCAPRSAPSARAPLTERQRDSVLAKSVLPGATVVGRALDVSDRATDRSAELAASDSLFR